jgi:copper chaperone
MVRFNVEGMTCGHCVQAVTKAIKALDPQADVQVDLAGKTVAAITGVAASVVSRAIEEAGYTVRSAA